MTDDSFEQLRKKVLAELESQSKRAGSMAKGERVKLLGAFVETCLTNLGVSHAAFARKLDIELELAETLLEGLLPESEIDDVFLSDIARAIDYEPNLLRIMLGREVKSAGREDEV